jgi:hypothetical protein
MQTIPVELADNDQWLFETLCGILRPRVIETNPERMPDFMHTCSLFAAWSAALEPVAVMMLN